jgi:hypothetical protein
MSNDDQTAAPVRGLDAARQTGGKALPPVHLWEPDNCRDIDMHIDRDGGWHYMGSPIGRERMVRLFSTVLRRDPDQRYYLVTPVEKCGITVEDVPFVANQIAVTGSGRNQTITLTTNVGDEITVGDDHPVRFDATQEAGVHIPYVDVRSGLEARLSRAVYYDLIAAGSVEMMDGKAWFGIWSGGQFWPAAPADEIGAA